MKFILTFSMTPESGRRDDAIERFKKTGGLPPKGATLIKRWIASDFSGGFVLLESNDPLALTHCGLQWSDVCTLRIVPVVEDDELVEVLKRAA